MSWLILVCRVVSSCSRDRHMEACLRKVLTTMGQGEEHDKEHFMPRTALSCQQLSFDPFGRFLALL